MFSLIPYSLLQSAISLFRTFPNFDVGLFFFSYPFIWIPNLCQGLPTDPILSDSPRQPGLSLGSTVMGQHGTPSLEFFEPCGY
jgi:hypothetical protein